MPYVDHNWMGDQAAIEAVYESMPDVIYPTEVDAGMAAALGCSAELQALLEAEGPKWFTRVRASSTLPVPAGCAEYAEADAVLICGVWAR